MMSEEEGESIHASVNSELRQLFSVREPAKKLSLILNRQELRSKAPKSLLARIPRLCTFCKDKQQLRVFLRQGKDRKRCCPKCNPEMFPM